MDLVVAWWLPGGPGGPGGCLEVAWWLPGGCLEVAWWLPGGCLVVAWRLPGGYLKYNNFVIAIYLYICFVILL